MPERNNEVSLVQKSAYGHMELTDEGHDRLEPWVTNTEADVYAFTPEADAQIAAAAMARLSRNPHDLRTIIAKEFVDVNTGKDTDLLRRVVSAYGDDSVMQLYPMQVVFEGVSNLATKEIEWGRFGAYLEQSTRYMRFDKRDENGNFAYVTPEELDQESAELYQKYMDEIFEVYSTLYEQLLQHIMDTSSTPEEERDGAWRRACHAQACDGVRSLLPASTRATVGMAANAQVMYNMLLHMNSHELGEVRTLGSKALQAVRAVSPVFFERLDMPTRGGLVSNHRRETREGTEELAASLLSDVEHREGGGPEVRLLAVDGSEDETIAKILADASNHSFQEVYARVAAMPEEDKQLVLDTYTGKRYNRRAKPGRAFELPHYLLEVQCDYGAFRDIQRHRVVDGFDWQDLSPELGHVRPEVIDEAGLKEPYEHAFKLSEELHAELYERGYKKPAQYATLFGHIMRFSTKINARALMHAAELRTSPQGHPSYRKVYQDIHEQVAAVHPRIAASMEFVSQDEDEELARLGAERYNQAKYSEA